MATNDFGPFAGRWINLTWSPQNDAYKYLFPTGGTLLIGSENENEPFYTLAWLDQTLRLHSISGFIAEGVTKTTPVNRLGVRKELESVECIVTLTLGPTSDNLPTKLQGTIALAHGSGVGTGPVGTFDADAHPVGEDPRVPRSSPGWLRRLFVR